MTEDIDRREICRIGASLFARGYVHSTAGNISVHLGDGFLITPTDACLGFLVPEDLSRVDARLQLIGGQRASKTLALHAAIARATGARCVLHTHSTHLVARSLSHPAATEGTSELLDAITPYFVMKVGHVPHIPYLRPGDPAVIARVEAAIRRYAERGTPIRAVMLERLGPVVWHDSPGQAMALLEELEETARLAMHVPNTEPLSASQIQELREQFKAAW